MSVGLNTGGVQAFGMQGPYRPNVASTEKLRVFLLGKNLQLTMVLTIYSYEEV